MKPRAPKPKAKLPRPHCSCSDFQRVVVVDHDADVSYLDQVGFEDRKRELLRGDFGFIGIRARVEVTIPQSATHGVVQVFESPGMWGIESDSDPTFLDEVYEQECEELVSILRALRVRIDK